MGFRNLGGLAGFGLFLALACFSFQKGEEDRRLEELHHEVEHHLISLRGNIERILNRELMLFHGMRVFVQNNPSLSEETFVPFADGLLKESEHLINLAVAPDMVVRFVHPLEGNEKVIGLNYRKKPDQLISVQLSRDLDRVIVSGPISLVQGGKGLILRAPVWLREGGERLY